MEERMTGEKRHMGYACATETWRAYACLTFIHENTGHGARQSIQQRTDKEDLSR